MNLALNGSPGNRTVSAISTSFIGLMCGVDFIKYSSQYLYSNLSICLTMYIIIFFKSAFKHYILTILRTFYSYLY
ncbi:hypothetical protein C0103_03255 [Staphylococcus aureus]|uniref:Uncharacterized protein n=1 Tax=Staphylococcus aureus TaxID=1280 RepID=A0AB74E9S4_STAAU|nr:hypothetical protein ACH32_07955 [Staphylococcus aureus]EFU24981.1 hypothetical protein CGSSa00_00441 [Staphylococcus aureus subsp. aureus CGS00]OFL41449.1 hypothetical protein HMPREF2770_08440 [Staphylococcus sp. HMSC075C08]OHP04792.1 hypothetical protein HMPREF2671_12495 [Staphylococcus sp. HMSC058E01]OHP98740.1 hypothetical protein HMPREF2733_13175 [Staphylococcus sp. HMSC063H12]OHS78711.1 hypothetical protein HMPREF3285_08965 [Staphylococcus sp. HMSC74F04]OHS79965.1 hypothetical protei